jgi:carbamoyltransferase
VTHAPGSVTLGLGGARRHACAALCIDGRLVGACEQERITRVRAAGPNASGLPDEAIDVLLAARGLGRASLGRIATAEVWPLEASHLDSSGPLPHHLGHAATAYLTSPWQEAAVLVCDHEAPYVSVFVGRGREITPIDWRWEGPGHAALYAEAANALGFAGYGQGQHLEAFARLHPSSRIEEIDALFAYAPNRLIIDAAWLSRLGAVAREDLPARARVAAAFQNRLADLLTELLADIRRATGLSHLCVAGGLFYNTHVGARVKTAAVFEDVFVPVNPGDAGLAVGAALHASNAPPTSASPFLGPAFDAVAIKGVLDNCKLNYAWCNDRDVLSRVVDALLAGKLVGWYDGAMEWGPRALGARSILANPFAPFVLENLNRFLKHREPWRGYALSCLEPAVTGAFEGPTAAPHMECDYVPRDAEAFRHVLPGPDAALRVQTVGGGAPRRFRELLETFGKASGTPALVNTSFNGFQEPIVCSPRDAIRVYYGTGLDMLVLDRFILEK